MTSTRAVSLLALLLALGPVPRGLTATLLVTSPTTQICVTSPDAEFQYRWGELKPQAGLFSYAPPGQDPLLPRITIPAQAAPGDLLRIVVVEPEEVESVDARLLGPKQRTLARGAGFRPWKDTRKDLWVALVGVSSLTEPGTYTISLTVKAGERSALDLVALTLRERRFRFERIALTSGLETLRTTDLAERQAQARQFQKIITTPDSDAVYDVGTIVDPLPQARRTSGYGDRRKFVNPDNTVDYSVHQGLDLAAPEGTPVPACAKGRVVFAGPWIITGNTVILEHLPGLFSLYFHLSQISVKEGEVVEQGQVIGKVGQTGFATGPHLHWEIVARGIAVDPDVLAAGPILDKILESGEIGSDTASKGGE